MTTIQRTSVSGRQGARAFDAIIVGGGQAGPSLAGRLADAGMNVALIERHHLGGTCVNTGCMPTKHEPELPRANREGRRRPAEVGLVDRAGFEPA